MPPPRRSLLRNEILRLLRRIPLPVLAILVGLFAGLVVWGALDRIQGDAVRRLFQDELRLRLEQRSRENLIRFDQYLANYAATTRLLANHRRLALYLDPLFWFDDEQVEPKLYKGFRPYWLPDFIQRNALTPPSQVLLVDLRGRIREIYQSGTAGLPKDFGPRVSDQFLDESRVRTVLTRFGDRPYLIVSDAADDASGYGMGYLVLVIPVDAQFLNASQQGGEQADLVALIDADDQRILASTDPAALIPGTQADAWRDRYLITSQSFSQYEGADLNILFGTFMSREMVAGMSARVRQLDKRQRLISALVFIGVFTLVIYLVSARLNRMLRRISRFSQRALGLHHAPPEPSGNQLLLLEDRVREFIYLVLRAREEMRRRHDQEMRETEALKEAILEASLDAIVTIDGVGRIVEYNPTAEQSFGYGREAVLGRAFAELFLPPESVPVFRRLLDVCRREGEVAPRELRVRRTEGDWLPVELSVVPIRLDRTTVFTLYLHDISARKQAERQIKSLARFVSESPNPILRINDQGVVLYANAASRPLLVYWACRQGQTLPLFWRKRAREVLEGGRDREWELNCGDKVFSLLFAPMPDLGYVNLYGRDVTAVRRAEQEVRRHQADLVHVCRLSTMGEMATGMAHELNQPLSAIVNYAHGCSRRLRAGRLDEAALETALGQMIAQARRASEIIRRLRGMVGKQAPVRDVVDMNRLVREVRSFAEFDAGRLGVTIELELQPRPLWVRVDLVQIEQVLLNLVRNALDALQEIPTGRRRLAIRTQGVGAWIRVEVNDSGAGIPPETARHLFEPFFTTKVQGMGMGLAISKTIVDEHGGRIRLDPRVSEGACFVLEIPAVEVGKAAG